MILFLVVALLALCFAIPQRGRVDPSNIGRREKGEKGADAKKDGITDLARRKRYTDSSSDSSSGWVDVDPSEGYVDAHPNNGDSDSSSSSDYDFLSWLFG